MSPKFLGAALLMMLAAAYVAWHRSDAPPHSNPPAYAGPTPEAQPDLQPVLNRVESRFKDLEERLRRLEARDTGSATLDAPDPDLAELNQRLASVEAQLRRIPDNAGGAFSEQAFPSEGDNLTPEEANQERLESLRDDFEDDDNADPGLQAELENAAYLFDDQAVAGLEFRRLDCRANYCRLEYEDTSDNGAEAAIAENELFLLLTDKYGQGAIIRGGEQRGRTRSVYIELPSD